MSSISDKVSKMESDIEYIKQAVDEIKKFNADFEKRADDKYASKLTEKMVFAIAALILIGVFAAIIKGVVI